MLGDNATVLADDDAIRMSMNLDRTPDSAGSYRVLVVVEAHQAGLRDRCRHRVESVEPAGIGNELARDPAALHATLEIDRDAAADPLFEGHFDRRFFRGARESGHFLVRWLQQGANHHRRCSAMVANQ
jgi:hypothetical protein